MKRFAEETTLHGIKEAWFSSRVGRAFWVVIFLGGIAAMVLQLETLFMSYINKDVGTRITNTNSLEEVDVPSFYYCHRHWLPAPRAFFHMVSCSEQNPDIGKPEFISRCLGEYAKATVVEDAINGIVVPRDLDEIAWATGYWNSDSHRKELLEVIKEVFDEVESKFGGNVASYIQDISMVDKWKWGTEPGQAMPNLDHYNTKRVRPDGRMPAHGVITRLQEVMDAVKERKYPNPAQTTAAWYDAFDLRDGSISVNMDGVCWEMRPTRPAGITSSVTKTLFVHTVIHLGAYIYTVNPYVLQHGYGPHIVNGNEYRPFISKLHPRAGRGGFKNTNIKFFTDLFVAQQDQQLPFFSGGARLTEKVRSVMIQFSTKKVIRFNRRAFPCRKDWTLLDWAHCNQEETLKKGYPWGSHCKVHLPASSRYPAIPLNESCTYFSISHVADNLKPLLGGDLESSSKSFLEKLISAKGGPSIMKAKEFLTTRHPNCPPPCTDVTYTLQLTYPDIQNEYDDWCYYAVDYLLRNHAGTTDQHRRWMYQMYASRASFISKAWNKTGIDFPCSRVEILQSEIDGTVTEEYPLYGLADLLSSMGGTIGLWLGASVLSFIQFVYICCLERFLARRKNIGVESSEEGSPGGTENMACSTCGRGESRPEQGHDGGRQRDTPVPAQKEDTQGRGQKSSTWREDDVLRMLANWPPRGAQAGFRGNEGHSGSNGYY